MTPVRRATAGFGSRAIRAWAGAGQAAPNGAGGPRRDILDLPLPEGSAERHEHGKSPPRCEVVPEGSRRGRDMNGRVACVSILRNQPVQWDRSIPRGKLILTVHRLDLVWPACERRRKCLAERRWTTTATAALQVLATRSECVLARTVHQLAPWFKGHAWAPGATPTAGPPRIRATQGRVHLGVTAASDRGRSSSSPPKNHRQGNPRRKICPPTAWTTEAYNPTAVAPRPARWR